jgi:PIN domain nuclease of toxin-antitoxin system
MLRAVADTHALVWYLFADSRLGPTARGVFDAAAVASITLAEIVWTSSSPRTSRH